MTIPLTKETLMAAYDYLRTTPPFNKWNLPEPEDMVFKLIKDPHHYGWHEAMGRKGKQKHSIAISLATVGHTSTLITTMAHEMVHLHQAMTGQATSGVQHNAAFKKAILSVCKHHGFDPKAF